MPPFCEQSPVLCSVGQYAKGCRGEDCKELQAAYKRKYRASLNDIAPRGRAFDRYGIRYPGDTDLTWREEANCKGVPQGVFFARHGGDRYDEARQICRACAVKQTCLEFALRNDCQYGMWGGLNEKERRRLKRTRAA